MTLQIDPIDGPKGSPEAPVLYNTAENIEIKYIDTNCYVNLISTGGSVHIDDKIDQHCTVVLEAATDVTIGQKFDQGCTVTIQAGGQVSIDQKIDGGCKNISIVAKGPVNIGQKIDGGSTVTLKSGVSISIGQKIDGNSTVNYRAPNAFWGEEGVHGGSKVLPI